MQYNSITISGSGFFLTAYSEWTNFTDPDTDNLLKKIDGWDSATKEIKTAPKGVGSGSYLVAINRPETTITVELQAHNEDPIIHRAFLRSIQTELFKDNLLDVTVLRSDVDGLHQQLETLQCYLKGYSFPSRNDTDTTVTLTLLCLNPEKTFELLESGVSTIEKGL